MFYLINYQEKDFLNSKKKNLIFILVFFIGLILLERIGLYQNTNINIDNISIKKPFGYRYSSVPIEDKYTKTTFLYNYLGLISSFKLQNSKALILNFKSITGNKYLVTFRTSKHEERTFMYYYNENKVNFFNLNQCIYELDNTKDRYNILGLIKNTNISFSLYGNNNENVQEMLSDICD